MRNASTIAAMLFALWGGFQLRLAVDLWSRAPSAGGLPEAEIREQAIWLVGAALAVLFVSLRYVPWSHRAGSWTAIFIVGVIEAAFVSQILLPGYVPLLQGLIGPVLGAMGILFAMMGRSGAENRRVFRSNGRLG